jgi:hypothetical protein
VDDRGNFYADDAKLKELIAERSGTIPKPLKDAPASAMQVPLDIAYLNRAGRRAYFAARRHGKSEADARDIGQRAQVRRSA